MNHVLKAGGVLLYELDWVKFGRLLGWFTKEVFVLCGLILSEGWAYGI